MKRFLQSVIPEIKHQNQQNGKEKSNQGQEQLPDWKTGNQKAREDDIRQKQDKVQVKASRQSPINANQKGGFTGFFLKDSLRKKLPKCQHQESAPQQSGRQAHHIEGKMIQRSHDDRW